MSAFVEYENNLNTSSISQLLGLGERNSRKGTPEHLAIFYQHQRDIFNRNTVTLLTEIYNFEMVIAAELTECLLIKLQGKYKNIPLAKQVQTDTILKTMRIQESLLLDDSEMDKSMTQNIDYLNQFVGLAGGKYDESINKKLSALQSDHGQGEVSAQ